MDPVQPLLQSNEIDYESELISDLLNRERDGITEMEESDPSEDDDWVKTEREEITEMEEDDPSENDNDNFSETEESETTSEQMENEDHILYRPLLRSIQNNDWKGVEDFVRNHPNVLTSPIKIYHEETLFHIIARNLHTPIWLLENLAKQVTPELLEELRDYNDRPIMFRAARYGNIKAAKVFVLRNPKLPDISNKSGYLPIHLAAECGHKETVQYLLGVTRSPLDDDNGVELLCDLINSGLYGIALDLLKRYPKLARESIKDRRKILLVLVNRPMAFESGSRFGYWKRLIYKLILVQDERIPHPRSVEGDMENPSDQRSQELTKSTNLEFLRQLSIAFGALHQKLNIILWNALMQRVPIIKCIRDAKLMHIQTLEIVQIMCHDGICWTDKQFRKSLCTPYLKAAQLGIHELVHEILKAYFYSYSFVDKNGHGIFELAVLNRQEKVFSLVKKMSLYSWDWKSANTKDKANILNLVGKSASSSEISGAALQMQRELQWFKAVESYAHPSLQEQQDKDNRTPRQVFTEEHKKLVEQGEKWMKDTAESCTFVAVLITTVVFAAAFTVPGGNNALGIPTFLHQPSFLVFAVSDALALFSSTASLIMFLGILTSRYAEEDFLESLPKKLIIGLITLFFSIASMMVAFGATVYLFLSHPWKWVIIPISLLGCVPVTLFGLLQFPLLLEIYSSTYRSSILQPSKE